MPRRFQIGGETHTNGAKGVRNKAEPCFSGGGGERDAGRAGHVADGRPRRRTSTYRALLGHFTGAETIRRAQVSSCRVTGPDACAAAVMAVLTCANMPRSAGVLSRHRTGVFRMAHNT